MDGIRFGALAPKIAEQLAGEDVPDKMIKVWQRAADAITRTGLLRVATDGEVKKMRGRLFAAIVKAVSKERAKK